MLTPFELNKGKCNPLTEMKLSKLNDRSKSKTIFFPKNVFNDWNQVCYLFIFFFIIEKR